MKFGTQDQYNNGVVKNLIFGTATAKRFGMNNSHSSSVAKADFNFPLASEVFTGRAIAMMSTKDRFHLLLW